MFDVSNLPFRDQFEAAVVVSGVCLAAAILLREWFADREIRIMARVLGLTSWAVVVTFAWRMTETNETLAIQIMAQKGETNATPIADSVRVVAVEKEFSQQIGETKFNITKYSDGRYGPVSVTRGCVGGIGGGCAAEIGSIAGGRRASRATDGSVGNMPDGELGRRF